MAVCSSVSVSVVSQCSVKTAKHITETMPYGSQGL